MDWIPAQGKLLDMEQDKNHRKKPARKKKHVSEARGMPVPRSDHQPSRAELKEETDMPKMSRRAIRKAFFRPFRFIQE